MTKNPSSGLSARLPHYDIKKEVPVGPIWKQNFPKIIFGLVVWVVFFDTHNTPTSLVWVEVIGAVLRHIIITETRYTGQKRFHTCNLYYLSLICYWECLFENAFFEIYAIIAAM